MNLPRRPSTYLPLWILDIPPSFLAIFAIPGKAFLVKCIIPAAVYIFNPAYIYQYNTFPLLQPLCRSGSSCPSQPPERYIRFIHMYACLIQPPFSICLSSLSTIFWGEGGGCLSIPAFFFGRYNLSEGITIPYTSLGAAVFVLVCLSVWTRHPSSSSSYLLLLRGKQSTPSAGRVGLGGCYFC